MPEIFGIPSAALFGQLLIGLINGSFYALLSLGLAVIFGLLNIINFTHGAQYMLGAFCAYFLLNRFGVSYWWSLLIQPLAVGAFGVLVALFPAARLRGELLVVAPDRAARRRRRRRADRAHHDEAALQARPARRR